MIETLHRGAPAELWQAMVREAGERTGHALDEDCESYLVFVLLRYQRESQLLSHTQALDWLHAQAQTGQLRADALRDVGDRCLLVAGLYPGLAQRRRVDVDYFVGLGRGAYMGVAEASRAAYAQLFEHLARAYRQLVRTLSALPLAAPARPRPLHAARMH